MEPVMWLAQAATQIGIVPSVSGLIALLAGILILIMPRILNYVVAAYLIVIGLIQILDLGM